MGKDIGDVRAIKAARAEMSRRGVDLTMADMRCLHGVMHIRGTIRAYRGANIPDLRAEVEMIARVLRQKAEIRDVVLECSYRS